MDPNKRASAAQMLRKHYGGIGLATRPPQAHNGMEANATDNAPVRPFFPVASPFALDMGNGKKRALCPKEG